MSDIPTDLFHGILKHVPVKSLFRFKSVCKTWRRIINDPTFAKLHVDRGLGDEYLIIRNTNNGKVFLLPLDDMLISDTTAIECCIETTNINTLPLPSCNGLFLSNKGYIAWFITNPFTGESLEIPPCDHMTENKSKKHPYCGIGYDEANDDYKVVVIFKPFTYVYSLSHNSWRMIHDFPDCCTSMSNGAFACGALHWVAQASAEQIWIVTLDLSTETYREIPLPSKINPNSCYGLTVHALGQTLVLSANNLLSGYYFMWMIKSYDDESKWVKVEPYKMANGMPSVSFRPIAYLERQEEIVLCKNYSKFLWLDLKKEENSVEASVTFETDYECYFSYQVSPASLVCLNTNSGGAKKKAKRGLCRLKVKTESRRSLLKKRKNIDNSSQLQRVQEIKYES